MLGAWSFAAERPNVIIVLTDDQGFGDLSLTGNPILKTPNMDQLAREGVQFTNFHVDSYCTPTRAALMTGSLISPARSIPSHGSGSN